MHNFKVGDCVTLTKINSIGVYYVLTYVLDRYTVGRLVNGKEEIITTSMDGLSFVKRPTFSVDDKVTTSIHNIFYTVVHVFSDETDCVYELLSDEDGRTRLFKSDLVCNKDVKLLRNELVASKTGIQY